MNIYEDAKAEQDLLVEIRRYLHRHPEAGMKEFRTAAYIREKLDEWEIPWIPAGKTGTVAVVKGKSEEAGNGDIKGIVEGADRGADKGTDKGTDKRNGSVKEIDNIPVKGPVLGLRGDIDALEMDELNEVSYASCHPGLMHACGHDGHTASLLVAAKLLQENRNQIHGTVKCIFQPGEECGEGAASVVESGAVDDVDGFFALHVQSSLPTGQVTIRDGYMSSSNDRFVIRITGKGCHGSTPQKGADALLAGAALAQTLQTLVSRESSPLEPTVITIGLLTSGTAFNILPEHAYLEGSIRVLREERRQENREIVERMAKGVAETYRCRAEVEFQCTAKAVYNDEELTAIAREAAKEFLPPEAVTVQPENLGAEDYGAFLEVAPVTYMNIGSGNQVKKTTAPHHHGLFDIDEDCLPICLAMYLTFAKKFFERKGR